MVTTADVDAEQELASLCGGLNTSYARLVAIVAGALAGESWAGGGIRSPEHWLSLRAGLSPFRARAIVAIARRAGELPTVMGQFAAGQLSIDQVAVVARYAPAHVEASVAELAVHASVPQLRRALSRYSFDPPADTGQDQRDQQPEQAATGDAEAGDTGAEDTEARDAEDGDTGAGNTGAGDRPAGTVTPLRTTGRAHPQSCRCPMTSTAGSRCGSAPRPTWARWSRPP
jgi:hypothetical protein